MREESRSTSTPRVKQQAREKIEDVKEKTAEQVETRLTDQKSRAASTLSDVARSLMISSQELRDSPSGASRYVQRAAEEVDRLADYLERRDVSEIVHQVEDLARRQPAVFVGGAIAVGFLAGRFLKSSERNLPPRQIRYPQDAYRAYDEPVLETTRTRDYGVGTERFE